MVVIVEEYYNCSVQMIRKEGDWLKVSEKLVIYIKRQFKTQEKLIRFLKNNSLYYLTGHLFNIDIENQFYYKVNKIRYENNMNALLQIRDVFGDCNINFISFKGMLLAFQLYDEPQKRNVGDIDIYVEKKYYSNALNLLLKLGYNFRDRDTIYNEHHIVLTRDTVTVELHKNIFNPKIGIDEKFLLESNSHIDYCGGTLTTFNISATLLHLIYHLYMDTCLTYNDLYDLFVNKQIPKVKRFVYRAYEIALFSEKFFDEIKWDDIVMNIKRQKLTILFRYMINNILNIFPNIFSELFIERVNDLKYIVPPEYPCYDKLMFANTGEKSKIDDVLSEFIDDNWNCNGTALCKYYGEQILFLKTVGENIDDSEKLSCKLTISDSDKGIKLLFEVSDNDFCMSDLKNLNTLENDGIHLLLCSTQKYVYRSIFFVPKCENQILKVVVYDVLKDVIIDKCLIDANIEKFESYYKISVVLSEKFLIENCMDQYFYMGYVIPDCDSRTKQRKRALILSEPEEQWYNPLCFIKVLLS